MGKTERVSPAHFQAVSCDSSKGPCLRTHARGPRRLLASHQELILTPPRLEPRAVTGALEDFAAC